MRTIEGNVGRDGDGRKYKETLQPCILTAKNKSMLLIFFAILKSHTLRSVNQESAKQEALQSFDSQSVLLVIDCDEISLNEIQRKAK